VEKDLRTMEIVRRAAETFGQGIHLGENPTEFLAKHTKPEQLAEMRDALIVMFASVNEAIHQQREQRLEEEMSK